jgi:hypothetical protein
MVAIMLSMANDPIAGLVPVGKSWPGGENGHQTRPGTDLRAKIFRADGGFSVTGNAGI